MCLALKSNGKIDKFDTEKIAEFSKFSGWFVPFNFLLYKQGDQWEDATERKLGFPLPG